MNLCVKPLNAAIQPLRKLPTRMALLNSPKSRVVQTTPQGALNQSPVLEVADVLALGREELDEAESSATHGIVTRGVLLGIGDEEGSTDVLHVEGSEAARNALCFESIFIKVARA